MGTKPKDLEKMVKTENRVNSSIEQATGKKGQQTTAGAEETAARKAEGRTQGRKGVKADRINMAFTSPNFEFIKIMSKATGKTMTEFTNMIIEAYRTEHPEIMEQAQHFLEVVNSGLFFGKKEEPKAGQQEEKFILEDDEPQFDDDLLED